MDASSSPQNGDEAVTISLTTKGLRPPDGTEAERIAYACGVSGLAPVIQRIIDLEAKVDELVRKTERKP
jgi:hypothetical protein